MPTGNDQIAEVPVSCGFPRIREIWFTLRFRGTITIATVSWPGCGAPRRTCGVLRCRSGGHDRQGPGPGSAKQHKSAAPRPGHDAAAHRATRPGPSSTCDNPGKAKAPARAAAQGTRASANTSGPDFTWAEDAGEIADPKIRTERRKLVSSAGPILAERTLPNRDPAVDLMSRRHPLSSTRATYLDLLLRSRLSWRLV